MESLTKYLLLYCGYADGTGLAGAVPTNHSRLVHIQKALVSSKYVIMNSF